jgi:hypothetical protein
MISGDTFDRWRIYVDGKQEWGIGTVARDTNLYRGASTTLQTDSQFRVVRPLTTDAALVTQVSGDTGARFYVTGGGVATFADGAGAADTNLYRSAADTLKTDDSLVVAGNLTVQGVNQVLRARKTADTQISSNTTVSDDPHLTIAVAANTVYELTGVLFISSTVTTGDFKMDINGPSGVAGNWTVIGPSTGSTTDPDTVRTIATAIGTGTRSYGIPTTGTIYGLELKGMVETSATAGNITVQWAQATSDPASTNLKIYSWMSLTKVA